MAAALRGLARRDGSVNRGHSVEHDGSISHSSTCPPTVNYIVELHRTMVRVVVTPMLIPCQSERPASVHAAPLLRQCTRVGSAGGLAVGPIDNVEEPSTPQADVSVDGVAVQIQRSDPNAERTSARIPRPNSDRSSSSSSLSSTKSGTDRTPDRQIGSRVRPLRHSSPPASARCSRSGCRSATRASSPTWPPETSSRPQIGDDLSPHRGAVDRRGCFRNRS
jgi:hypothetical protein